MDKLDMQTKDLANEKYEKLKELFPNAITETIDVEGNLVRAIDKDILTQEISTEVVEGREERYQFTWPDKRQAIVTANAPISKTLRPCREESVNFDETENLYIEGDNLEVLKLLQETYLGKIKMIYIDPPYNTGSDFVYNDNFSIDRDKYLEESGQFDEVGNRLEKNLESNGRFHTDWLNMMYPRLKLARNLLTEDGVIFISIDDNEQENLKKICDEIFGESNFIGTLIWSKKRKGSFLSKNIISMTEYVHVYFKNKNDNLGLYGGKPDNDESQPLIKRTNQISTLSIPKNVVETKLKNGIYKNGVYGSDVNPIKLLDDVKVENNRIVNDFRIEGPFIWSQSMFDSQLEKGAKFIINTKNFQIRVFKVQDDNSFKGLSSYIDGIKIKGTNEDAYEGLEKLFNVKKIFDYSKPHNFIKYLLLSATFFNKEAVVLDFFSGSSSTAHATMQLNAEDDGSRKFIMVQLPEETDEKSEAYKAGYQNITEIGKERIRRAGKKILEENQDKEGIENLDIGFRVLKTDTSNMKDVYYVPADTEQSLLDLLSDNIKEDRRPEDLLFQVMLDLGVSLSSKIEREIVDDKEVFIVEDGFLIACFDKNINDETVKSIANKEPYYAVFRDSSMANDSVATNFEQIFESISPQTVRKVI